ncbi:MAG TPA: hypothetical protein VF603_04780 [Allosphingosinicella sp.]|jgi:hypothetical protein
MSIVTALAALQVLIMANPNAPAEVVQVRNAWFSCAMREAATAGDELTPRQAAAVGLAACQALQSEVVEAQNRWLEANVRSERRRRRARRQMAQTFSGFAERLPGMVRMMRRR